MMGACAGRCGEAGGALMWRRYLCLAAERSRLEVFPLEAICFARSAREHFGRYECTICRIDDVVGDMIGHLNCEEKGTVLWQFRVGYRCAG